MTAPFAACARRPGVGLVELATALAAEFRPVDHPRVADAIATLGVGLPGAERLPAPAQLEALAELMRGFQPTWDPLSRRPLLIDAVLHDRAGDPLVLALLATDLGRLTGLDVAIAGGAEAPVVAHRRWNRPFALQFRADGVGVARLPEPTMTWRCPHQVMRLLLGELLDRSRRGGDWSWAVRAAELQLALPLDRAGRRAMQAELAGIRAALN